ncbi:MAG: hypothetical protein HWQ38_19960 [Nostoc sp. NMS7]|uniref:hypothetical protein n=1 Tax=Nostoc sp. NMS7 TaxID=2815391 RepID=UPI0025DC2D2C|nr:hypothetical protein [Nostoc sp. NMS7]MBN3948605.1 hypothetical protein [Nostoc sp. NMS7]
MPGIVVSLFAGVIVDRFNRRETFPEPGAEIESAIASLVSAPVSAPSLEEIATRASPLNFWRPQ